MSNLKTVTLQVTMEEEALSAFMLMVDHIQREHEFQDKNSTSSIGMNIRSDKPTGTEVCVIGDNGESNKPIHQYIMESSFSIAAVYDSIFIYHKPNPYISGQGFRDRYKEMLRTLDCDDNTLSHIGPRGASSDDPKGILCEDSQLIPPYATHSGVMKKSQSEVNDAENPFLKKCVCGKHDICQCDKKKEDEELVESCNTEAEQSGDSNTANMPKPYTYVPYYRKQQLSTVCGKMSIIEESEDDTK